MQYLKILHGRRVVEQYAFRESVKMPDIEMFVSLCGNLAVKRWKVEKLPDDTLRVTPVRIRHFASGDVEYTVIYTVG